MTDAPEKCGHEACTCAATEGEYCSDHCREHSGRDDDVCGCGHAECAGTIGTADTAVGTVGDPDEDAR
jgi:hypothetical protein